MPGLLLKFGGAIFIGLLYQFYYGEGDTFNFFTHSKIINSSLNDSPVLWLKVLFGVSPENDPYIYRYSSQMLWYTNPSSYAIPVIGAIFGLLNGTTYMPIALLFAFFSYSGIWVMFRTFTRVYPSLHKQLAFAFLYIPSTIVWGSGVFKDTVCMFGLGWITYTVFRMFVDKDFSVRNLLMLAFSFYLIALIKVYILVAFIPGLMMWLLMTYSSRIKQKTARWAVNILFIGASLIVLVVLSQRFAKELGQYSLENLAKTAKVTQDYINYVSEAEGGSAYDLGTFEPTIVSMVSKFPQAVVVTLFRPFLWEAKKPIMLLSALESFCFVLLVIAVLYKRGFKKTGQAISKDPNLAFFFIYSIIFAFAVGISTGNFGTLSRYKIPCIPFFAALLVVLYYRAEKAKSNEVNPQLSAQIFSTSIEKQAVPK
ncbi:hypothetical protein HRH25_22315 [Flavisolibacter sp. BT320]|nr:hypothetical protein [Flavisolibacter longurius]